MSGQGSKSLAGTHSVPYVALLCLFVVAFVWRMEGVTQWPMPFHPMLQYENALNVRAMWYENKGDQATAEEKHWLTGYQGRSKGLAVTEWLLVHFFCNNKEELSWTSGIVTILLWFTAACFLGLIARRQLHSEFGAFVAVSFFLLHPFGVVVSRSFQHEAAQMLGFLVAWWWLGRRDAYASWSTALMAGIVCGLALLLKPGIGWIPLCFIHLAYGVQRNGWRKTLLSPWLYVVPILALLPSLLWMKYMLPGDEIHQWKWFLLLTPEWYVAVWQQISSVIGWAPVLLAVGVAVWDGVRKKWFLPVVLPGFVAYVAVFNYATMTHDYYLLMLIPLVGLGLGQLASGFVAGHAVHQKWQRTSLLYAGGALICWLLTWPQWGYASLLGKRYLADQQMAELLGKQLGAGTHVIALTNDYAMPLRYFSGLHAQWWPTQGDLWYEGLGGGKVLSARERLARMLQNRKARYFVITLEEEFQQQKDLVDVLKKYRELPTHPAGVRIFELAR